MEKTRCNHTHRSGTCQAGQPTLGRHHLEEEEKAQTYLHFFCYKFLQNNGSFPKAPQKCKKKSTLKQFPLPKRGHAQILGGFELLPKGFAEMLSECTATTVGLLAAPKVLH